MANIKVDAAGLKQMSDTICKLAEERRVLLLLLRPFAQLYDQHLQEVETALSVGHWLPCSDEDDIDFRLNLGNLRVVRNCFREMEGNRAATTE